ncbi:lipoprotein [Williamsoniiplasma luminosum]|uniref:Uncharacterized protein n=1 Tax=Williamsoniiplasma luminosum TaxID=214888 RepID=A0A2S0NJY8_9MOLU|nr:lipoprotein [Williamsoniiplasma luminosum]AVP49333.1 MAG: hypothetical protein C5T88_01925 [Williamsoniiplasma luminosum]
MKKLLSLLGSIAMVATTAATVVACNPNKNDETTTLVRVGETKTIDIPANLIKGYDVETIEANEKSKDPFLGGVSFTKTKITFKGIKEGTTTIELRGHKNGENDQTPKVLIKTFTIEVKDKLVPTPVKTNEVKKAIDKAISGESFESDDAAITEIKNVLESPDWKNKLTGSVFINKDGNKYTVKLEAAPNYVLEGNATITGIVNIAPTLIKVNTNEVKAAIDPIANPETPFATKELAIKAIENVLKSDAWKDKVTGDVTIDGAGKNYSVVLTAATGHELEGNATITGIVNIAPTLIKVNTNEVKAAIDPIANPETPFATKELAIKAIENVLKSDAWKDKVTGDVTIDGAGKNYSVVLTAATGHELEGNATITGIVNIAPTLIKVNTNEVKAAIDPIANPETPFATKELAIKAIENVLKSDAWKDKVTGDVTIDGAGKNYSVVLTAATGHELEGNATITGIVNIAPTLIKVNTNEVKAAIDPIANPETPFATKELAIKAIENVLKSDAWKDKVTGDVTIDGAGKNYSVVLTAATGHELEGNATITGIVNIAPTLIKVNTNEVKAAIDPIANPETPFATKELAIKAIENVLKSDAWKDKVTGDVTIDGAGKNYSVVLTAATGHELEGNATITGIVNIAPTLIKVNTNEVKAAIDPIANPETPFATKELAIKAIENVLKSDAWKDKVTGDVTIDGAGKNYSVVLTAATGHELEGNATITGIVNIAPTLIKVNTNEVKAAIDPIANPETPFATKELAIKAIENVLKSDAWKDKVTGDVTIDGAGKNYSVVLTAATGHELEGNATITGIVNIAPTLIKVNTNEVKAAIDPIANPETPFATKELAIKAIENVLKSDAWKDKVTGDVTIDGAGKNYSVVLTAATGHELEGNATITGIVNIAPTLIKVNTNEVKAAIDPIANPETPFATKELAIKAIENVLKSDAWKDKVTGDVTIDGAGKNYSVVLTAATGHELEGNATITGIVNIAPTLIKVNTNEVKAAIDPIANPETPFATKELAIKAIEDVLKSDAWKDKVTGDVTIDGAGKNYSVVLTAATGHELEGNATITGIVNIAPTLIKVNTNEVKAAIDPIANPETPFATKELAKEAIENVLKSDAWKTKVTGVVTIDEAGKNYSVVLTAATGHELEGNATITGIVNIAPTLIKVNTNEVKAAIDPIANPETPFATKELAIKAIENVLKSDAWKDKVTGDVTIDGAGKNYSVVLTAATGHELEGNATITGIVNIAPTLIKVNTNEVKAAIDPIANPETPFATKELAIKAIENVLKSDAWKDKVTGDVTIDGAGKNYSVVLTAATGHELEGNATITGIVNIAPTLIKVNTNEVKAAIDPIANPETPFATKELAIKAIENVLKSDAWKDKVTGDVTIDGAGKNYSVVLTAATGHELEGNATITGIVNIAPTLIKVNTNEVKAAIDPIANPETPFATKELAIKAIENVLKSDAWKDKVTGDVTIDGAGKNYSVVLTAATGHELEGNATITGIVNIAPTLIKVNTNEVKAAIDPIANPETPFATKELAIKAIENVLKSDAWKDKVTGDVTIDGAGKNYSVVLTAATGHELEGNATITGIVNIAPTLIKVNTNEVKAAIDPIANPETPFATKELAIKAIENVLKSDAWKDKVTGDVTIDGAGKNYSVVLTAATGHELEGNATITGIVNIAPTLIKVNTNEVKAAIDPIANPETPFATKELAIKAIEDVLKSDAWKTKVTGDVTIDGAGKNYSVVLTAATGHELEGNATITGIVNIAPTLIKVNTNEVKAAIDPIANPETPFATKELAIKAIEDVLKSDAWKTKVTGDVTIDGAGKNYSVVLTAATGHELEGNATITGIVNIAPTLIKVNTNEVKAAIDPIANPETPFATKELAIKAIENVLKSDAWKDKVTGDVTIDGAGKNYSVVLTAATGHELEGNATITGIVNIASTLIKVNTNEVKAAIDPIANPETPFATKELAIKAIEDVLKSDAWKTKVTGVVTIDEAGKNYSVVLTAATGHELEGNATITGIVNIAPTLIKVNTNEVKAAIDPIANPETPFATKELAIKAIENVLKSDAWKTKVTGDVTIDGAGKNYSVVLTAATGHELEGNATITGTVKIVKV